jgi:hypothetical protein
MRTGGRWLNDRLSSVSIRAPLVRRVGRGAAAHVGPGLLGDGRRLFDNLSPERYRLSR